MTGIPFFEWSVSSIVAERLGWVLVHTVWQFALIALVARVTVGAMGRTSALARHGALLVALSITLAAPVVTWFLPNAGAPRQPATGVVSPKVNANVAPASEPAPPSTIRVVQFGTEEQTPQSPPIPSDKQNTPPVAEPAPVRPSIAPTWSESIALRLRPWLGWIDALWLAGVLVFSARPLLGWHVLRRLERVGTSPASEEVVATLRRVSMRLGIRHAVRVLQSTLTQVPIVVGYFRPVVLLPVSLMTTIPAAQLEALLAHELAHVRRHDFVVNLLQTLLETLFFYHPAIWWLSHRVRVEREHCCDDLVVRLFDNRVDYGRALVAVEVLRGRTTVLALGAADGSLLARVRRIAGLSGGASGIRLSSRWPVAVASLAVALATFVSLTFAAKNGRAGSSPPSIATLPGNITVELIGVGNQPPGDIWWRPDGSKLENRPTSGRAEWMNGEPDQADCREFAIRMSGLRGAPSVSADFDGKSHSIAGRYSDGEWTSLYGAGPFETGFFKPRTTTVRLGLSTDPFGPTIALDPFGKRLSGDDIPTELKPFYDRFVPLSVDDLLPEPHEDSNTGIKLVVDASQLQSLYESAAWELNAIDVDGQKQQSTSTGGNYYFGFDLPRERLARFEFRLRPYRHWVTFENVSLQSGRKTNVKVSVESKPGLVVGAPLFADELLLQLTPELAHDRHWFFVDLDHGRLVKPPFRVELSIHVPFFAINPPEEQLTRWLAVNGVDLLIFVGPARTGDTTGRWSDIVCTRFVRTKMEYVNDLLVAPDRPGGAWRFQDLPADLLTRFARRSDAPQTLDFVPFASANHALTSFRPDAYGFRTAENVVGAFLLAHTNPSKEELTLRIAQLIGATTPLNDLDFAGHVVSGAQGASDPPRLAEPLIAKLPGGLEVELVGVTKNMAPAAEGWTPAGQKLGIVGDWPTYPQNLISDDSGPLPTSSSSADARDLLLRMRSLRNQPSYSMTNYDGMVKWIHAKIADPYQNRICLRLNEQFDLTDIQFLLTDEPWGPWQQVGPDGKRLNSVEEGNPYRSHYQQISLLGVGAATIDAPNSEIQLEWPWNRHQVLDFQIKAVDVAGEESPNMSGSVETRGNDATRKETLRPVPPIPLDRLARFEYRLRPYRHRVTFENVSLQPGRRSQPSVKVEPITILDRAADIRPEAAATQTATFKNGDADSVASNQEKDANSAVSTDWGEVKNGLRVRVIPVSSSMSEDAIDPAQRRTRFATSNDVAFAVEMQNVSSSPIRLLDTRYGENYGDAKGKANSNWLGQFLFSIDLFDRDGKLIERPKVDVVDPIFLFDSPQVKTLDAGQTHRFLLRPTKWLSPMTQRIEPGSYRAAVCYHGLPARVATRIREYRPTSPVLTAIEGDVLSPQVSFEVEPPALNAAERRREGEDPKMNESVVPELVWSEPTNGLRAAMELIPRQPAYAHGTKPDAKFHVQNVSKETIVLPSPLWLSEIRATVEDDKGKPVELGGFSYTGWVHSCRVTLKPQQVVIFDAGNIAFAQTKERADKFEDITNRILVGPPGQYTIQLDDGIFARSAPQLRDGKGKVLSPLDGDWAGQLKTGQMPLTIVAEGGLPVPRAITPPVSKKAPPTPEEIQEVFSRKVSLQAKEMPLREALAELARQAGVPLEIDVAALTAVGVDLDTPVTADLTDEMLNHAILELHNFREYHGIVHSYHSGKLVLTTLEAMQARIVEKLPDWLKPLYNRGLVATLNDDHRVVAIHAGDVLTDELLARIATLPDLRELNLGSTTKISAAGLVHLAEMSHLEKLTLSSISHAGKGLGDEALKQLVGLKSLRELYVLECGTTDAGATLLEQLPQLTHLTLHQDERVTDDVLTSIGTLKRLKRLDLSRTVRTEQYGLMHFTAAGLQSLADLRDLEELHLVGQEVTAEFLAFPRLTSLSLGGPSVDDACAEKIAACRNLQTLSLVYTAVTDAGLSRIAALPALRRLTIDSYIITDAGIEHLKSAKSLEHLSLRAMRLSDESLHHIAEMKSLTRLDLNGSGQPGFMATGDLFSIHAIASLKSLPQLRTLYLTNVHSTGGFLPLRELKQVRVISMMMANISESDLEELEAALPKAWISNTTGSTGKLSKALRQRKAPASPPADKTQPNPSRPAPK